ncbi:MAG: hypothetical protein LC104_00745 [Bacteroidales bacterium]|nr:hypothetical protein [Bacteroidales bacterium]
MNVAVWVEQQNGKCVASVLGAPQLRAVADTRERAVAALRSEVETHLSAGELLFLDVEPQGLLALAGRYEQDDAAREQWDEIITEIYRQRDEEKLREFPE